MLIPSLKGIVGPVVLPILGAVPDGAIVIFSGLGPIADAQEQVAPCASCRVFLSSVGARGAARG